MRSPGAIIGMVFVAIVVLLAILGPLLAPYSPIATIGIPGQAPTAAHILGLDFEGRDVLSRLLYGGRTTLFMCVVATLLTYAVGLTIGLIAGYTRSFVDSLLMRMVDVFLSLPALLVMLVMVTALGPSQVILIVSAALVLFPGVARIVRTSTLEVSRRGYVEAAIARGENTISILRREILPNIAGPIIADLGLRFSWSIILISSVNFLGLGISPPNPDWGLMIAENRIIISENLYAVLAPSVVIAILILGVNLVGDAFVRSLGESRD
jgi:ABC-type dipeptide/oligopeptide/nickel transport system permease subunit